jgi:hypothetical protein
MKLLIAGSRGFETYDTAGLYTLFQTATELLSINVYEDPVTIISGGARGIDSAGETWAGYMAFPFVLYVAQWNELGKRAGYIRNAEMAEACDAAILVWDGESRGTMHMRDLMSKARKPYVLMSFPLN